MSFGGSSASDYPTRRVEVPYGGGYGAPGSDYVTRQPEVPYGQGYTGQSAAAASAGDQRNWDRFGALMGAMGQQQQQAQQQRGGSLPQPALSRGDAASLQVLLQLLARRGLLQQRMAQAQGGGQGLLGI